MTPNPELIQCLITEGLIAGHPWKALTGGKTNQLWRVGDVVVKQFQTSDDNPRFPNDPAKEIKILRHLGGHQLAQRLLGHVEHQGVTYLVYRHLSGNTWQKDATPVGRLLQRVHSVPAPSGLRRQLGGSDALEQHTVQILKSLPTSLAAPVQEARPTGQAIPPVSAGVLLHGDPVPGNIITTPQGCRLIDWQCPAYGDPVEDLAIFLSPAMQLIYRGTPLSDAEINEFLQAYDRADVLGRLQQMQPWHHWAMAAYCAWKVVRGAEEYEPAMQLELDALQ